MYNIKKILASALLLYLANQMSAQVKLNISLMSDQETYLISILPETSWEAPFNSTASIQVVLKMAADKPFLAGQINSMIPGITWIDNAYVDPTASTPDLKFVCFALNERGTKKIAYQAGVETPLFTFKNLESGCVGKIELLNNDDQIIEKVVQNEHINITHNITVLGAKGNAFTEVGQHEADCTVTSGTTTTLSLVENLTVFPIPVVDFLKIKWMNNPRSDDYPGKLQIYNSKGVLMERVDLQKMPGEQSAQIEVSYWPTGLYNICFVSDTGNVHAVKFIVVNNH